MECGPDDDHADTPDRARLSALAQSRPGVRAGADSTQDAELAAARSEIARLEETVRTSVKDATAGSSDSCATCRLHRQPGFRSGAVASLVTADGASLVPGDVYPPFRVELGCAEAARP